MNADSPEATGDIQPEFNDQPFEPKDFINHMAELTKPDSPVPPDQVLTKMLEQIQPIDFNALAGLDENSKPRNPHYHIITIEQILKQAKRNKWGLCRQHDFIYLYNGAYWSLLDTEELKAFLGDAAEMMGVDPYKARHYSFKDQLHLQFLSAAHLPKPKKPADVVLINLQNGTFEISPRGTRLRPFDPADFLTYQLPFEYDPEAKAPQFEAYLNKVLPDQQRQMILAEYLGYVFIKNGTIKEEKVLFLYGSGANGKSVFHEIVRALLGPANISQYSLQDLTNESGYYRAMIANILVNYASEISGKLQSAIFKQMASGETISARLPYGKPIEITDYAKLIFNVNELPRDVEQSDAFFRRFLIIPFEVTIPEEEQDKQLHNKIIANELSGVFNWVLEGLNRLLAQKQFTHCEASQLALDKYKLESDSVKLFLEEEGYEKSPNDFVFYKDLYLKYKEFCTVGGFPFVKRTRFKDRLIASKVTIEKINDGIVAYLTIKGDPAF